MPTTYPCGKLGIGVAATTKRRLRVLGCAAVVMHCIAAHMNPLVVLVGRGQPVLRKVRCILEPP
eukprot:8586611-Alexandrium_andersonii.AAC.1